jgi:hypothetical protein
MDSQANYDRYKDMRGEPSTSFMPLERDTLRRFVQAIIDSDPTYFDDAHAATTKFGQVVAPPLYPVHAFRYPPGLPDPLDALCKDKDADGTQGSTGLGYGLPAVESPYKRLLNGGNEIEFFRALRVGEKVVAHPRYVDVTLKQGKSGNLLVVVIETRFTTEAGEPLLTNKQSLIWR